MLRDYDLITTLESGPSERLKMEREEVKAQVDELMRQYHDEEIDGQTYQQKMMNLISSDKE